jgi:hypothetical protein
VGFKFSKAQNRSFKEQLLEDAATRVKYMPDLYFMMPIMVCSDATHAGLISVT